MSALAEIDMLRQAGAPAKPARPKPRRIEWLRVKFFWPTYTPEDAFVPWLAPDVRVESKSLDGGRTWLPMLGPGTLDEVRDWMLVEGLAVLSHKLLGGRRVAGRWRGLYAVVIGKKLGGVK